jgi:hypothetical protein
MTLVPWNKGKTKEEFPQLSNSGVKSGHVPWNKGKTGYKKISTGKGRCLNTGKTHFKKGAVPWNKGISGYVQPDGTGEKISKALRGHRPFREVLRTKEEIRLERLSQVNKRRSLKKQAFGTHDYKDLILWRELNGNLCAWCEKSEPEIRLSEDHIKPLALGGTNLISNIQFLCRSCNSKKHLMEVQFLPIGLLLDGLNFGVKGGD